MEITLSINNGKKFEHFKIRETFIPELTKMAHGRRVLFITRSRLPETVYDEDTFFETLKWAVTEALNREKVEKPYTDSIRGIEKAKEA